MLQTPPPVPALQAPSPAEAAFQTHLGRALAGGLDRLPMGERMAALAKQFLGTPYATGTLESPDGQERLVVALDRLDCVTFLETVLSLARVLEGPGPSYAAFCAELQATRYRNGVVDGYASRLHYLVDGLGDNARRGRLEDLTAAVGGDQVRRDTRVLDLVSRQAQAHPRLGTDTAVLARLRVVEAGLRGFDYIPKAAVAALEDRLQTGDLIALTARTPGLDCAHAGIAYRDPEGRLRLVHASRSRGQVALSAGTLSEYLAKNPQITGIRAARARAAGPCGADS